MNNSSTNLEKDSLGLGESIIMGVAGTAPAFSVAATTGALIAAVGTLSVASLLYSGLIMFGITLAYLHLNRINAHAGAAYAWVGEVFHPVLGFFAGWSLLVASAVFMVSGTIPAATSTIALIAPEYTGNVVLVALVAGIWLSLISFVVIKGTKLAAIFQVVATVIELAFLVFIVGGIFWYFSDNPVIPFKWSELSITAFTPEKFAAGALASLFFFWGWDVTLNLSEETTKAEESSGKGAIWAMIIVLALFIFSTMAVQLALTPEEIQKAGTNVLLVLAEKVFPAPYSYMAVAAVMLSTVGTLETTMLQFSRTMFAKGRDGVLHHRYAVLHERWKTPWISTLVILSIGLFLLFLSSFFPSVNSVIEVSVKAIGFQVAFYYGLTGYACTWLFRKRGMSSLKDFITLMLWPFISASFMVFITYYSMKTFDLTTTVVGVGGIVCGVIPFLLNKFSRGSR
jgi:amino acid transporter